MTMHKDIRLHGLMGDHVEYFVTVVGNEAYQTYFFNIVQEEGKLRIFSPGNEFVLTPDGISYQGNGGYFCEYMFGVDQPSADIIKPDIINRLVMYGARTTIGEKLRFSDQTQGEEQYEQLFFEGNAVCNYFFFVHSTLLSRRVRHQQEELVKSLGKVIKRSATVGEERDDLLIAELFPLLKDDKAQLFMIKLVHRWHRDYRNLFQQLYFKTKKIADDDFARLVQLAATYRIDRYQQERMRIDVMYRHPSNRRIVDEYRAILLSCSARGEINQLDNARLTRLKTLSVRNKIPGALINTLDERLKEGLPVVCDLEQHHITQTREILEGLFLKEKQIDSQVNREDMLTLILAKKVALETRDRCFDQLVLDTCRKCDEIIRDGADPAILDGFSYLITYLDRFDSVFGLINQLAFMENVRISEEMLQGLMEHRAAFENLKEQSFHDIFIADLFANSYLGRFGKRKVTLLLEGLQAIEAGTTRIEALHQSLKAIDQEERISLLLLEHARERIRNFYSRFSTKADQEALRRELTEELKARRQITGEIPPHIFNEIIVTIKKEAVYLHSLLPQIVSAKDVVLREDFLLNSGLDRFYVEELEREYYEKNNMDIDELYEIRKGLN